MATPAYEQLLVVQGFDTTLRQLEHRFAHHPIRGQLAEINESLEPIRKQTEEIEQRRHDLERQRKRIDDEVVMTEERRKDIDRKLYDGSVTATKDLLALQDEAAHLLARQRSMEDDELEVMEQLEVVGGELETVMVSRADADAEIERLEAELATELAAVEAEQASTRADRDAAAAEVPAELLARYDELRFDFGGVAVARLIGSTCDGCHMSLSAVAIDQLKKLPDDAVVTCDDCGRLLIR